MLYTFNLHDAIYQISLNKTGFGGEAKNRHNKNIFLPRLFQELQGLMHVKCLEGCLAHEHLISISYDYYFNQCYLNYYQILVNTFINQSPFSMAVFLQIKCVFT